MISFVTLCKASEQMVGHFDTTAGGLLQSVTLCSLRT